MTAASATGSSRVCHTSDGLAGTKVFPSPRITWPSDGSASGISKFLEEVNVNGWLSFTSSSTDLSNGLLPGTSAPENLLVLLERLPPRQQEVLRLKFGAGLSYKEIARITSHSVSYVGVLIHEGMKALRAAGIEVRGQSHQQ